MFVCSLVADKANFSSELSICKQIVNSESDDFGDALAETFC